jgi:hypothetical protein
MTVTTGIIATATIVTRWRDDASPIPTSDDSDRRVHHHGRDRCVVAGGRRSSLLGGRDRQHKEGVQKGPCYIFGVLRYLFRVLIYQSHVTA